MTKAGYTCDSCGTSVSLHAKRCPSCGKAFDAVRCPRCGHAGSPETFTDGCPSCRYLATPQRPPTPRRSTFVPTMAVLVVLLAVAVVYAWVLRG